MIKKLAVFFLLAALFPVCGYAQAVNEALQANINAAIRQSEALEAYKKFDQYYYNYARNKWIQEETLDFLYALQAYRQRAGTEHTKGEMAVYVEYYKDQMAALRAKYPNRLKEDIETWNEYNHRPMNPDKMYADFAAYQEYEGLVYDDIKGKLRSNEALAYLNAIRSFRAVVAAAKPTDDILAAYNKVRSAAEKAQGSLSNVEKILLEEYLKMKVSLNKVGYDVEGLIRAIK